MKETKKIQNIIKKFFTTAEKGKLNHSQTTWEALDKMEDALGAAGFKAALYHVEKEQFNNLKIIYNIYGDSAHKLTVVSTDKGQTVEIQGNLN